MDINIETSKYAQKAMELFKEGYNCSQSVFLAFEDKLLDGELQSGVTAN